MMGTVSGPDEDFPTLIGKKDHLNVLRYIRCHQMREPELVCSHGRALLGTELSKTIADESSRLTALEQICLAAVDVQDHKLADICLSNLKKVVSKDSARFRVLLGRCLESAGDLDAAEKLYDSLLQDNSANLMALKRKYCLLRSQVGKEVETMDALNAYLQQNIADTAGWYEMARYCLELGNYKGAAYAMEEVVLGCPLDSQAHCQLGEVYATLGGVENLQLARKHMAQSLELDESNRRALFGLVSVASAYLEESSKNKKNEDNHDVEVATELVKYGADKVIKTYKGTDMFDAVQRVMNDETKGL
jgi:tetratricopeptide (TPR) repeat protein